MKDIVIPSLHCPIPSLHSVHAEEANRLTIEWARQFRLVTDEEALRRLRIARFGWLGANAHRDDSLEALSLATDWVTWLFFHDDMWCDDVTAMSCRSLTRFASVHEELINILNGTKVTASHAPLAYALEDIRERMLGRTSTAGMKHFVSEVRRYFEGNFWEMSNYIQGIVPDVATYTKMRPYAGALYTCFDIGCIAAHISLTPEARGHLYIRQLTLLANNCVTWVNDIFSLEKEIREQNMSNLVLAIQSERNVSLQEAMNSVSEICNAEIRAFDALASRLTSVPVLRADEDVDLRRYVALLQGWIRGNLDWSMQSGRYGNEQ